MAANRNPSDEEILAEEDENNVKGSNYGALTFLRIYALYILVAFLFVYYLWQRVGSPYLARRRKIREEEEKKARKAKKEAATLKNREAARLAAIERLQKKYDEEILKMQKVTEEREERKRQKQMADFPDITPGRKLNESSDHSKGREEPTYRANRGTYSPGTSGNKGTV